MTMKKLLALLLAGAMLLPQASVFAEEVKEGPRADAIVVEAEESETYEGAFNKITGAAMSGGGAMQINSPKEVDSLLELKFDVEVEDEYDVWLLASSGSVLHLSNYQWFINDDSAWRPYSGLAGGAGYTSGAHGGIAVSWIRLAKRVFTPGEYSISFSADKLRALASDFMFVEIDNVCIVPSSWGWTPNGVAPPYDARVMKFEYAGGKISNTSLQPKHNFKVTVTNKILEEMPYVAQLYTELQYKGEKVVGVIHDMAVAANKWKRGKDYSNTVQLTVPYNAPDGEYEVWTGIHNIGYANGEKMVKVGDVTVGAPQADLESNMVEISEITLPETVERQVPFTVDVAYTPTTDKKAVKPYLEFYNPNNEKELWYVAEGAEAVDMAKGVKETKTFEFTVKDVVPDGEYDV